MPFFNLPRFRPSQMSRTLGMGALSEGQEELVAAKSEALWPTVGVCVLNFVIFRFPGFQLFRFLGFRFLRHGQCVCPTRPGSQDIPATEGRGCGIGGQWPLVAQKKKKKKKKNNRKKLEKKKKKEKEKRKIQKEKRKRGLKGVPPETAQKKRFVFWQK